MKADITREEKRLSELARELAEALEEKNIPSGFKKETLLKWRQRCAEMEGELAGDLLRVAVVGAIKSGKSSFINSWIEEDLLRRGAGVITSIVTRIRSGKNPSARLFFKGIKEINNEIKRAAALLPGTESVSGFDITSAMDRQRLLDALSRLKADVLVDSDALNINGVILLSYLKGYEKVASLLEYESSEFLLNGSDYSRHRDFVGNQHVAIYLKDVEITINSRVLPSGVEIADCQGSDSLNPLHLAMIQDYLTSAHLLLYVISSRTGIRQADIKFLNMIRKMGIEDRLYFILNFDIAEHDSLEEIRMHMKRAQEELAILFENPSLFACSALLTLFKATRETLSAKDADRLAVWEKDTEQVEFLEQKSASFSKMLSEKIEKQKTDILLESRIDRLIYLTERISEWAGLNLRLLEEGDARRTELIDALGAYEHNLIQISQLIENTLKGAIGKKKNDIRSRVDSFFDPRYGKALAPLFGHVENYSLDPLYEETLERNGLLASLYSLYQDFSSSTDRVLTEEVNPLVLRFIKELEHEIIRFVEQTVEPFEELLADALNSHSSNLTGLLVPRKRKDRRTGSLISYDSLKNARDIRLHAASSMMRYSAHVKTEAFLRFGTYRFMDFLKRLFKRPGGGKGARVLFYAVERMKRETKESITRFFKNFSENLKFQHFFKILDEAAMVCSQTVVERFSGYSEELAGLRARMKEEGFNREMSISFMTRLLDRCRQIQDELKEIRKRIT